MNRESGNMAALLLLVCLVPAAASAYITKPHVKVKVETVYLYHASPCPEGTLIQSHMPDGRVSCVLQKKPHGAAVYREYMK